METFKISNYEIQTSKITEKSGICLAVLSDLHGFSFGKDNQQLQDAIRDSHPDSILILGDMNISDNLLSLETAKNLLLALAADYPVYYALGNHESKLALSDLLHCFYDSYEKELTAAGVIFLHNDCAHTGIKGDNFWIHGLELPLTYYQKPNPPGLSVQDMTAIAGPPSQKGVHILLAHSPRYGDTYFDWNADLILCGHYHGGVLRFHENHGLISPYFQLFPPYCCGHFQRGEQHMLVSAGLGEHTISLRIHNPRELLIVRMKPLDK